MASVAPTRFRLCQFGSLSEADMVQTTNRFFDEVARLMNDAAGVAQGVRRDAETMFRTQAERMLREFAVIQREEFEAVKDMARLAREENEALKARLAVLEARLGVTAPPPAAGSAAGSASPASATPGGEAPGSSASSPSGGAEPGTGPAIPPGYFG
jgi:BMFP domain-containing protein YqiC